MASASVGFCSVVLADTLITCAPASTAARMPSAIPSGVSAPGAFGVSVVAHRTGRIRTPGATPTYPVPWVGLAAMIPATNVPCPKQSVSPGACPGLVVSTPGSTTPCSCGTWPSTPVSPTPTVMPDQSVSGQACSGASCRCAQGTDGSTLCGGGRQGSCSVVVVPPGDDGCAAAGTAGTIPSTPATSTPASLPAGPFTRPPPRPPPAARPPWRW